MPDQRVLVVGTTPDYIAYIHGYYPERALFLTDVSHRVESAELSGPVRKYGDVSRAARRLSRKARGGRIPLPYLTDEQRREGGCIADRMPSYLRIGPLRPGRASEVVCQLLDTGSVYSALLRHLEKRHQNLSGVVCYDCERLSLAAELAGHFSLPFPSVKSVRLSRDKFLAKKRWAERGVRCPGVELVHAEGRALSLIERFGGPVVLKPTEGTGSELTFYCRDRDDLTAAYRTIKEGLAQGSGFLLNKLHPAEVGQEGPDYPILAEAFVEGREYSADFIIENDHVHVIRVAEKFHDNALPFGTTMAYAVPAKLPGWINDGVLEGKLRDAANALEIKHAICMVDFMIRQDEIILLELTPRIGGDCLPPLIRRSCGLDTIGFALDFAEGRKWGIPPSHRWTRHVGMRIFSPRGGVLSSVSCGELSSDARVRELWIKHAPGHRITAPPEDYDSWLLGHVIFEPRPDESLETQCNDLKDKIAIIVEPYYDRTLSRPYRENGRHAQPAGPAS